MVPENVGGWLKSFAVWSLDSHAYITQGEICSEFLSAKIVFNS